MFRVYIKSSLIIFEGLVYNVCIYLYLYINIYAHIFILTFPSVSRLVSKKLRLKPRSFCSNKPGLKQASGFSRLGDIKIEVVVTH